MEKKRKTMRKQDWSIDEWLEASRVKHQKQQAKQARTITRDRKLRESVEIIISSQDSCIGDDEDKEEVGGGEKLRVTGSHQDERRRIPEHAAADGDSSQETLILGNRRVSGS